MHSPAIQVSPPSDRTSGDRGHIIRDAQHGTAPVESSNGNGQSTHVTHSASVVADSLNGDQGAHDVQARPVSDASEGSHRGHDSHCVDADPSEALLLILADALDDMERTRIANENRLRSLAQVKGLAGSAAEANLATIVAALADLEHGATLDLQRAMRKHPLGPWVKRTVGIGEKQGARLIAAIGNPYWNHAEDRPRRGPAELWAYCGYDPKQKRRKGIKSNWNADAKKRAFLCAESCMKSPSSPLRAVYDAAREKAAKAVHSEPCPRCGPQGKPALAGSPLSKGHQHARALREVAKEILKDLWRESRRLQPCRDDQKGSEPSPAREMVSS